MPESDDYGLRAVFPNLGAFEVSSPQDMTYNCVAWAAFRNDIWMWPDQRKAAIWPKAAPREESIAAFESAFESLGFAECDSDDSEPGFVKIAIFESDGRPTHVARQLSSGQWTSRCGQSVDISHELRGLEGALYGRVVIVMSKRSE